jgi:alpha-L-fucosidase
LTDHEKIADKSQKEDGAGFRLLVRSGDEDLGSRAKIAGAPALVWYPAEVNTSIRPGWFYHAHEDDRVKSLDHLLEVYYGSVGGNACFLLNLPPDRRGLIHENDAARMRELGSVLRRTFADDLVAGATATASESRAGHGPEAAVDGDESTWWAPTEGTETAWLELDLGGPRTFDRAVLQEAITEGQRLEAFVLEVAEGDGWREVCRGTTIGYKRLPRFGRMTARRVRLSVTASRLCPTLSRVGLFLAP